MTAFRGPEEAKPGRRRIVEPAGSRPLEVVSPSPPVAFESVDLSDESDAPDVLFHPASYVDGLPARWSHPLCTVEDYSAEDVAKWDRAEYGERSKYNAGPGARVVLVVQKFGSLPGATVQKWDKCGTFDAEALTEDTLRASFGPGAYSLIAYLIVQEPQSAREIPRPIRRFGYRMLPRMEQRVPVAPPAPAPVAPSPAPAPGPPAASPIASFGVPGLPPGMPAPQTVHEWAQVQMVLTQIEQQNAAAAERAAKARREAAEDARREDERQAEKQRAQLLYQQQWNQMMTEAARSREALEDARAEKKAERDQERQDRILALQAKAESNATTDPVERLKLAKEALAEAKELFGIDGDGERNVSGIERAMSMASTALAGHGGKIIEVVNTLVSNRAKVAELEAQVAQLMTHLRSQPAPRAPVRPIAAAPVAPASRPQAPPPAPPVAAAPSPPPAPVVEPEPEEEPAVASPAPVGDPDEDWPEPGEPAAEIVSETIDNPAPAVEPSSAIVVTEAAPESEDDEYEDCPLCLANPHDGECPHSDEEVDRALALLKSAPSQS